MPREQLRGQPRLALPTDIVLFCFCQYDGSFDVIFCLQTHVGGERAEILGVGKSQRKIPLAFGRGVAQPG